jgi:hypothetical protein
MPANPALGRLRQKDHEFYTTLNYTVRGRKEREREGGREDRGE